MGKKKKTDITPSIHSLDGNADSIDDLLNGYGTYNVQQTQNTDNDFPAVSQGLPKNSKRKKMF